MPTSTDSFDTAPGDISPNSSHTAVSPHFAQRTCFYGSGGGHSPVHDVHAASNGSFPRGGCRSREGNARPQQLSSQIPVPIRAEIGPLGRPGEIFLAHHGVQLTHQSESAWRFDSGG
jgi:hypothetical protein